VAFQKAGDDRDDGGGLGGVAFETADFQWEARPVDQQSDDNLRVDAALLAEPTLRSSSSDSASKYNVFTS
jgi:hypothetical protein